MSQASVSILLTQTSYSGISTITGQAVPAASYYITSQNLQTLSWSVTNLIGTLTVQASLADTPTDNDWFDVYVLPNFNNISEINYYNLHGNFVWLRVNVSNLLQGVIQNFKVSY